MEFMEHLEVEALKAAATAQAAKDAAEAAAREVDEANTRADHAASAMAEQQESIKQMKQDHQLTQEELEAKIQRLQARLDAAVAEAAQNGEHLQEVEVLKAQVALIPELSERLETAEAALERELSERSVLEHDYDVVSKARLEAEQELDKYRSSGLIAKKQMLLGAGETVACESPAMEAEDKERKELADHLAAVLVKVGAQEAELEAEIKKADDLRETCDHLNSQLKALKDKVDVLEHERDDALVHVSRLTGECQGCTPRRVELVSSQTPHGFCLLIAHHNFDLSLKKLRS